MAQVSTPPENSGNSENAENSKTESVNLLSQALGPVTGVLVPRVQIYSSQKVLTEILGPLNSFKFHSLEKGSLGFFTHPPFPVEVRDSSDRVLFRFFGRATGQLVSTGRYGGARPLYMAVLVDSQQRDLLYAKPMVGNGFDPEYNLSCVEGGGEQSVGKVAIPSPWGCDACYRVTALNLFTNQSTGPLMEAQGTSSNCCCSSSDTLLFGCPDPNSNSNSNAQGNFSGSLDPRVVGELKRMTTLISNNPNGASQVTFAQKLPIVHKIWILFICYHHHYRNFANTSCSRNGQRGSLCNFLNILIWTLMGCTFVPLLVFVIVLCVLSRK